jgi:acetoin utilization deacetylase AcuC-like enzyme
VTGVQTCALPISLLGGVQLFLELAREFEADFIFIACGADGHQEDPLSSLEFTVDAFREAAKLIRSTFPDTPILIGGAGGYLPDSRTPEVWANFAHGISTN